MLKLVDIPRPTDRLLQEIQAIKLHDHVCLIYRDPEEGLFSAAAFIKAGLELGDRCVYVSDDNEASAVSKAVGEFGIDVDEAITSQKLVIAGKKESYLVDGSFDPKKTIKFFAEATREAKAQGYRGLRGAAEMTWQLGGDPGCDRLLEYESAMNDQLFPRHPVMGVCQFNLGRFSAEIIREVIFTHPKVIIGGLVCRNFYYKPPEVYRPSESQENAEQEVMRMLENIYDFEKNEVELRQSRDELEQRVKERTSALEAKTNQLKEMNSHLVGREYRIRELEAESQQLNARLDQLIDQVARGLEPQLVHDQKTTLL